MNKFKIAIIVNFILIVILQYSFAFINDHPKFKEYSHRNANDAGEALYLTPLLDAGKITEAREKATVRHKLMNKVTSYSGYFTVNQEYGSNLFFWYFPAQMNPKDAPLALWLQGGPGATSMIGLFLEHGPFIVLQNKTLKMREYSWNTAHNMLYIDSPVGTGFSFTKNPKGYVTNETEVGRDLLAALLQFFKLFPDLKINPFFVTGESYAGKYVPAISYAISQYNEKSEDKINLQGLAIGNGFCDPENQLQFGAYLYQNGLLDAQGRDLFNKYENEIIGLIKAKKFTEGFEVFDKMMWGIFTNGPSLFKNLTGFDIYYNYLYTVESEDEKFAAEWIQQTDVRRAIHVGNNPFNTKNYATIMKHLKSDILQSINPLISYLLQRYRVLLYNGQLDIIVAYVLTENFLQQFKWPGAEKYRNAMRKQWWVDQELAGYTKTVDNLTEVLVRNAGHMVPSDQPKWALDLITRFMHGKSF